MKFNSFKMYKRNFSKRNLRSLLIANAKASNSVDFRQIKINSSVSSFPQNIIINEIKKKYTTKYFLKEQLQSKNSKIKLRIAKKILKSQIVPKPLNLFY